MNKNKAFVLLGITIFITLVMLVKYYFIEIKQL